MKQAIGLLCGFLGGLLGGLIGVGGGVIMIPLMTWLAKISQHKAHGTSLVAIIFTGLVGAGTYYFHGSVDWRASLVIAVSAVVTARFGALFAHSLPEKKLKKAFGFFLIFASLLLLAKTYVTQADYGFSLWQNVAVFLTIGCLTGFVSGMMGVGGGAVMVPPLVVLANMEQHMAQGTSLLAMIPGSITGALTHHKLGNVEMKIALGLAAGSLLGSYLGATAASYIPEMYLRLVFVAFALWMSIRYVRA